MKIKEVALEDQTATVNTIVIFDIRPESGDSGMIARAFDAFLIDEFTLVRNLPQHLRSEN